MKIKHLALGWLALGFGCFAFSQSTTNTSTTAPSGITVTQPTAQTVTSYTPAIVRANAAQTASLVSSYFTPMLSATGVTPPSGSVTRSFTVVFFSDGSSRSVSTFCATGTLPAPPETASSNAN